MCSFQTLYSTLPAAATPSGDDKKMELSDMAYDDQHEDRRRNDFGEAVSSTRDHKDDL